MSAPPRTDVVLDRAAGLVRASGHLTRQGADLLRGAAEGLRGEGHATVLLDLRGVVATDEGAREVLRELAGDLAAAGVRLLVREPGGSPAVTPPAART